MKFKYISIFATLFFFIGWSYAFEPLKLVCNGEFEETKIESFKEKEELTNGGFKDEVQLSITDGWVAEDV